MVQSFLLFSVRSLVVVFRIQRQSTGLWRLQKELAVLLFLLPLTQFLHTKNVDRLPLAWRRMEAKAEWKHSVVQTEHRLMQHTKTDIFNDFLSFTFFCAFQYFRRLVEFDANPVQRLLLLALILMPLISISSCFHFMFGWRMRTVARFCSRPRSRADSIGDKEEDEWNKKNK